MKLTIKFQTLIVLFVFTLSSVFGQGTVTDLRSLGYSIFPAPQNVALEKENIIIDGSWQVVSENSISQKITDGLNSRVQELHHINFAGTGSGKIELKINKEAVIGIAKAENAKQAYSITIKQDHITIEGNQEVGLFYGIQSFLQLMKPVSTGKSQLPMGTIMDWPDLELRFIHWDTKHHRDKMETLKRYIDWSAYFKVNAIAFEIEDKYEYPSHPVIAGPNAFSKEEMHELTKYALDRFIQLIPNVQAPAHMAFVLKHKEFEHLKADNNNFQICMCDEEAMELIFDMYQDMIDATPGVDYFFASTDEVYYAGICDKCEDEYNDENRSQAWVDYVKRINTWMAKRGRRVLAWVEYPLLPKHISQVPSDVIDAIMGSGKTREWIDNENKAGIEQLSYSSIQGSEHLFPNYFPTTYRGRQIAGRLSNTYKDVSGRKADGANLIGTFAAAWDDSGLHNETFWLGWATVTQYGWTNNTPSLHQNIADFMDVFYGYNSPDMAEAYILLEEGARYYEALWDRDKSTERATRRYGNSFGKGIGGESADLLLHPPALPSAKDLSLEPTFRKAYGQKIEEASVMLKKNELLILQLMRNITRVGHNRYNIEVLLSIASLERYTMTTVLNLAKVEDILLEASKAGEDYTKSVNLLVEAHQLSGEITKGQEEMWTDFKATWEKSRLPKNRREGAKEYLHVFDDVKDHTADRRVGLEYILAPFERIGLDEWRKQLSVVIKEFAGLHNLSITGLEAERLED